MEQGHYNAFTSSQIRKMDVLEFADFDLSRIEISILGKSENIGN